MGLFSKPKPVEAMQSEEYHKIYNLYVEVMGKVSLLKSEIQGLALELENLKSKYKYLRATKNPEESANANSSGLPTAPPKGLNTYNPFN